MLSFFGKKKKKNDRQGLPRPGSLAEALNEEVKKNCHNSKQISLYQAKKNVFPARENTAAYTT